MKAQTLTPDGLARAREWYEQAIALDPAFALAHSTFAFHFAQLANYGSAARPRGDAARPRRGAQGARDRSVAARRTCHAGPRRRHLRLRLARGGTPIRTRDGLRSGTVAGAPVLRAGTICFPSADPNEAVEECARALQEDPLDLLGRVRFAQCLRPPGRRDEATSELRRVLELDDNLWFTHFILGLDQLQHGELAAAMTHAEKALQARTLESVSERAAGGGIEESGDVRRAEEVLQKLRSGQTYGTSRSRSRHSILLFMEIDAPADWTERAIGERHPAIFFFLRAHAPELLRELTMAGAGASCSGSPKPDDLAC